MPRFRCNGARESRSTDETLEQRHQPSYIIVWRIGPSYGAIDKKAAWRKMEEEVDGDINDDDDESNNKQWQGTGAYTPQLLL